MRIKFVKIIMLAVIAALFAFTSCTEDLNTTPIDDDAVTSASLYQTAEEYRQVLAKCYAGLAISGQQGPAGMPDISGLDEGFSQYLRLYWELQELPTDEAIIAWNDGNLFHLWRNDWGSSNEFIRAMYNRLYYQIALENEFIREAQDGKLDERGISGDARQRVEFYRAEARFLRAFSYWNALDMFGNVPFVTEEDKVGSYLPEQISRSDLFDYVESELLDIVDNLKEPKANEYGRVDKAAAWMLLAKLYMNAEVYTGTARWNDAMEYLNKIVNSAYSLHPSYQELFLADNHTANGIIFPIAFDGKNTQTYGGTNFIIHAAVGGDMVAEDFGIDGGWGGTRATSKLWNKFDAANDPRYMFFEEGQQPTIENPYEFTQGYAVTKFKNVDSEGNPGSDIRFADTDWPMFRLADAYLMYAEAVLRGAEGGTMDKALQLVNDLRTRAGAPTIGDADLSLDFILDERARELYWEGHRRIDLIRFGKFTGGDYLWPWKGAVQEGKSIAEYFRLYPIPASDINANTNLVQNDGYVGE